MLEADYRNRVDFAQFVLDLEPSAIKYFICTDEAFFYLTPIVKKQNCHMWLKEKPLDWIERPLQDAKILAWVGISANKI